MGCTHLLAGYHDIGQRTDNGKRLIKILKNTQYQDIMDEQRVFGRTFIPIPCGNCKGCRLARAREWALRCMHEAELYDQNYFITLTFNDEHLNSKSELDKSDFQNFMKRLRKKFVPTMPKEIKSQGKDSIDYIRWEHEHQIRFYHCGEYGDRFNRPHHHACIFNLKLDDLVPLKRGLWTSETIKKIWSHPKTGKSLGYHSIGEVNYDTAAYVARYITKKINGKLAPDHYQGRQPEYTTMSRRPGIGGKWYKINGWHIHEKDQVAFKKNGRVNVVKPPKYYDRLLERVDAGRYEEIKEERREYRLKNPSTEVQRGIKSDILDRRFKNYKRTYEDGTSDIKEQS